MPSVPGPPSGQEGSRRAGRGSAGGSAGGKGAGRRAARRAEGEGDGAEAAGVERRRAKRRRRKRSLRLVRTGLTLVLGGLGLVSLVVLSGPVVWVLEVFVWISDEPVVAAGRVLAFVAVGASVLSVAGRVCCLVVPAGSRARQFIYGAVALDVVSVGLQVGFVLDAVPDWLGRLGDLASVGALVLFVLFLFRLAIYLKLHEAAKEAETLLGWGVWLVIALAALEYVLPFIPILGWVAGFFLSIAVVVLVIVMFFNYVELVWWLRNSIE